MPIPAIGSTPSVGLAPVDPSTAGSDFQVGSLDSTAPTSGASSFGGMLMQQLGNLNDTQNVAAADSQALATGKAQDVTQVVSDVEKAALEMQLAVQVRNKAVDAYQEIFRIQI
jgi:flagellar hook-basal body complex protein FliE